MTKIKEKSLYEKIIEASSNGSSNQLKILILQSKNNIFLDTYLEALEFASANGHAECVKLLIPVSSPKANNSQATVCL